MPSLDVLDELDDQLKKAITDLAKATRNMLEVQGEVQALTQTIEWLRWRMSELRKEAP